MPTCSTARSGKSASSCWLLSCVLKWLQFFLFCFFCCRDTRLLLRFAQTSPSDLAVAKDQEEACHCLLPLPISPHSPPYMGCGRRCPGWSSLSRSRHSWSGGCQRGDGLPHMEKGSHCSATHRPLSHTVIGVINWTAVPLQYPPHGSLSLSHTHTLKIQCPELIW